MPNLDGYIKAVWKKYAIWGFVTIVAVLVIVVTWLQWLGVDVAGYVNRWMGQ